MQKTTEYDHLAEFANSIATLMEEDDVELSPGVSVMDRRANRVVVMLNTSYKRLELAGQIAQAIEEQFGHRSSGATWQKEDDNRIFISIHTS